MPFPTESAFNRTHAVKSMTIRVNPANWVFNLFRLIHAHHIEYRSLGGPTIPENEISTCRRCHALLHAGLLRSRWFVRSLHLQTPHTSKTVTSKTVSPHSCILDSPGKKPARGWNGPIANSCKTARTLTRRGFSRRHSQVPRIVFRSPVHARR